MSVRWFDIQPLKPSWQLKLYAIVSYIIIGIVASIIRLSRADFNVFPFLVFFDFYGSSPNFFVCFAGPLFTLLYNKEIHFIDYVKISATVPLGLTLYEFVQLILPGRTFDVYDIVASFVGGVCSILLAMFFVFKKKSYHKNV